MEKIKKYSQKLKLIVLALLAGLPIVFVLFWTANHNIIQWLFENNIVSFGPFNLGQAVSSPWLIDQRALGFTGSLIALLPTLIMLFLFHKIFTDYGNGIVFTKENARRYQYIGGCFLLQAFVTNAVSEAIVSFALTMHNAPGNRFIKISAGTYTFESIFSALIIMLIAWVMYEGAKLKNEQELTV